MKVRQIKKALHFSIATGLEREAKSFTTFFGATTVRNPGQIRKRLRNVFSEASENGLGLSLDVCKEQLLESVNFYQKTTLVLDALDICEPDTVLASQSDR